MGTEKGTTKANAMKKIVYFHGNPIALTDAQVRDLQAIGKRKPKLKRAEDKAWEKKGRKE